MNERKKHLNIYDIARDLDLSPATISKVLHHSGKLSEATQRRVLEYVKETGYVANSNARMLKAKHTWAIGVVFSDIASFGFEHPFFGSVIQAFKNYVEKRGFELVFIVNKLGQTEMTFLQWAQNKNVDGIFILTGDINDPGIIELVNSEIPCVSADIIMPGLTSAMSDDSKGIELGFGHLLSIGCKSIAAFAGPMTSRAYAERAEAYRNLLAKNGMKFQDQWYRSISGYGYENAYTEALKWIDSWTKKPEGIISFSDDLAMGLINALKSKGIRVPEDISVIGYDDINFSELFDPPLTTIRQDKVAIAEAAADMLLDIMKHDGAKDPSVPIVKRIPVELVIRKSTK